MTAQITSHAASKPSSLAYLSLCLQFDTKAWTEQDRLEVIVDFAEKCHTAPQERKKAHALIKTWLNTLQWTSSPLHYERSYLALKKYDGTLSEDVISQNDKFRFELMCALRSEISHTTMLCNKAALKMGVPLCNPLNDFLSRWDKSHDLSGLLQAKLILDNLYVVPDDENIRDECNAYASTIFNVLSSVFETNSKDHVSCISLPDEFTPTNLKEQRYAIYQK